MNQWTQDKVASSRSSTVAPRAVAADAFGLVEPDHGLGQRVVVAVADAADRGDRAGVGEAVGVADRGVLAAGVGVMDTPVDASRRPGRAVHNAISSASSGSSVGIDAAVRQPTMRREYTSVTNAVNAIPDQVGT